MDWREMASRPTVGLGIGGGGWNPFESGNVLDANSIDAPHNGLGGWKASVRKSGWGPALGGLDLRRGWVIAVAWMVASGVECVCSALPLICLDSLCLFLFHT